MGRFLLFSGFPTFVAAAQATHPPSGQANVGGTTLVIPVPAGVRNGDLVLFVERWESGTLNALPAGLTEVLTGGVSRVSKRVALSEPASYTFSNTVSGLGRSGCSIAIRGGTIIADSAFDSTLSVPTVTAPADGSVLVGLSTCTDIGLLSEKYGVSAPMTLGARHVGDGNVAYGLASASAVAYETIVAAGTVSGRSFTVSAGTLFNTFAVIVEPG